MAKTTGTSLQDLIKLYSDFIEDDVSTEVEAIPTGSMSLDISLGIGGVPCGRIIELFGSESSGKTSLSLSICSNAIKMGKKVLYVDVEQTLDYQYARQIGGDNLVPTNFILSKPDSMERAMSLCEMGINSGEFGVIILDSIGGLSPEKEQEDELTDANVALVSRMMTKFLRRNAHKINKNNIAFIFINQVRDSIGSYVKTFSTPGGHALKHYTSARIMLSKSEDITVGTKEDKKTIGISIRFVVKKNKLAPPFKTFSFPFIFGKGIDTLMDAVGFAEMLGVLEKRGSYYLFQGENIGQGKLKAMEYFENNKEDLDKLLKMCYNTGNLFIDKEEGDGANAED